MHKDKAKEHILKTLDKDETLIGFFQATKLPKIWLYLLIGPLASLNTKLYFIALTNKGVRFYPLTLIGNFHENTDFFKYPEIETIQIKDGILQMPMLFKFVNGNSIKVRALKKGVERAAKLTEESLSYLRSKVNVT